MPPQKNRQSVFNHTIRWSVKGLVATTALLLSPNPAHAEPPHYRVELAVPPSLPECNRQDDLIGMVLPMLAAPILDPPATRALIVRIAKAQSDYHVDVVVQDLNGQTLDEERSDFPDNMSCHEVLYRAAVRAAVKMSKGVKIAKLECPRAPPPLPTPPCPTCEKPQPSPKRQRRIDRHWFVGPGASTVLGATPTILVGLQATLGWKWAPSWSIETNLRGTFPADALPEDATRFHVYSLGSVTVAPCFRVRSFGLCGLTTFNNMWTQTIRVKWSRNGMSQSFDAGMRAFLEKQLTQRWSVRIDGDLVVPLFSRSIDGGAQVHWDAPPVNASANVSFFVWF